MNKLRGNLTVLQYLYSLSDLTFFLVPANNISLVANQIPMLELSIMYAVDGEAKFGAAFQQLATTEPQSSTASYGIGDLFGSLSKSRCEARPLSLPWLLVSDTRTVYLTSIVRNIGSSLLPTKAKSNGGKSEYEGTVYWDRVRFILTKIGAHSPIHTFA